jgi:hypothetical protein
MKTSLITDSQSLTGAKSRFGHAIPIYDDGYGPLFIHRDSMGISGVVRAQTWEDAYEICEDEFFPEASDTMEEIIKEYGEQWMENELFQEVFGFRPNGARVKDTQGHGIYAKDLNGDSLEILTPSLLAELEITLEITSEE